MTDASAKRDTPVIFSKPMVLALLSGRKTMTRRLAWREKGSFVGDGPARKGYRVEHTNLGSTPIPMQYAPSPWQRVKPGNLLWVRENWRPKISHSCFQDACDCENIVVRYCADPADSEPSHFAGRDIPSDWVLPKQAERGDVPCIHMPRWASRLTLEVTATKIERLQDISGDDARAEGCEGVNFGIQSADGGMAAEEVFRELWKSLHGPESWDANPEVVALTFSVHQQNIDAFLKQREAGCGPGRLGEPTHRYD